MSAKSASPEQVTASLTELFAGRPRHDQMALLGKLEFSGAALYRGFAAEEKNLKAREALLKAAEREEANGQLLILMTTPKNACEKCGKSPPANAYACSFQCTFCENCADAMNLVCPNCGGALEPRAA